MPDWTYQTVIKPIFRKIPYPLARSIALKTVGSLGLTVAGRSIIAWLGHMAPDQRLATVLCGQSVAGPVWLACELDPQQVATLAWSQFGFGIVEVGPYSWNDSTAIAITTERSGVTLDWQNAQLHQTLALRSFDLDEAMLKQAKACRMQLALRVDVPVDDDASGEEACWHHWQQRAQSLNAFLVLDVSRLSATAAKTFALKCEQDQSIEVAVLLRMTTEQFSPGEYPARFGSYLFNRPNYRSRIVNGDLLHRDGSQVVHCPAREPGDAIDCLSQGATMVALDAALPVAGPGIVKRINQAELYRRLHATKSATSQSNVIKRDDREALAVPAWLWACFLGLGMLAGGVVTLFIGAGGVLLPYDEAYLSVSIAELKDRVPRIVAFMAHDRVTLAGTMLAVGLSYFVLGCVGIRRGLHWAMMTIVWSTAFGFPSFFLFLVFGYFDPLHAFIAAVFLQLTFQMMQSRMSLPSAQSEPCLVNDTEWKLAQWGQLLLVAQGIGLTVAGVVIGMLGSTQVFVQEDLDFLQLDRASLETAFPRLVSVIAHDRASFGGMLMASGALVLHIALWGFARSQAWLWWLLMMAGSIGYCTTLIVHGCVGYSDWKHLLPANLGLIELWFALALSWPYLCTQSQTNLARSQ
jgi:dihydroorotate dehydrogenase